MAEIPQTGQQQERAREAEAREQEKRKQREQDQRAKEQQDQQPSRPRGPLQTSRGVTTLDEVVVAKIAGMAAREVPGVYDMGSAARRAFSAVTDRIPNAQTNVAGGISVEKGDTQAAIDVTVVVDYGASIVEVGNAIRRNIIDQVEGATGLEVIEVNVNVADVHLPDEGSDSNSSGTGSSAPNARNDLK